MTVAHELANSAYLSFTFTIDEYTAKLGVHVLYVRHNMLEAHSRCLIGTTSALCRVSLALRKQVTCGSLSAFQKPGFSSYTSGYDAANATDVNTLTNSRNELNAVSRSAGTRRTLLDITPCVHALWSLLSPQSVEKFLVSAGVSHGPNLTVALLRVHGSSVLRML